MYFELDWTIVQRFKLKVGHKTKKQSSLRFISKSQKHGTIQTQGKLFLLWWWNVKPSFRVKNWEPFIIIILVSLRRNEQRFPNTIWWAYAGSSVENSNHTGNIETFFPRWWEINHAFGCHSICTFYQWIWHVCWLLSKYFWCRYRLVRPKTTLSFWLRKYSCAIYFISTLLQLSHKRFENYWKLHFQVAIHPSTSHCHSLKLNTIIEDVNSTQSLICWPW